MSWCEEEIEVQGGELVLKNHLTTNEKEHARKSQAEDLKSKTTEEDITIQDRHSR